LRGTGNGSEERRASVRLVLKEQLVHSRAREGENLLRVSVPGRTVPDDRDPRKQLPQARHGGRGWSALQVVRLDQHSDESRSAVSRACLERRDRVHDLHRGASTHRVQDAKTVRRLTNQREESRGSGTSEIR